jgi:quaternary ammonium compound-resistance protein SugE
MNWIMLIVAGLFEVVMAFCLGPLQGSDGRRMIAWVTGFIFSLAAGMYLLYRATLVLPPGTAYAVGTGIGALGTVVIGLFLLDEPSGFWRLFFTCTLIAPIVGLKIVSP